MFNFKIFKVLSVTTLLVILFLSLGCAPTLKLVSSPVLQNKTHNYFKASIKPLLSTNTVFYYDYFNGSFELSIENKTKHNMELVWDKTLYMYNGATNGGFMFEGVLFRDRHNSKPSDVVFAESNFKKTIWQNNLVSFTSGNYGGWSHEMFKLGNHGIYLTVKVGNEIIHEKLVVNLREEKIEKY